MDTVTTTSTSANSAICSPVELRRTDRIRLAFHPMIVRNDAQPKACINGVFVYERKSASGDWEPMNTESLGTIKTGEQYRLEIHSDELLTLVQALGPLYRSTWRDGVVPGTHELVRMETSAARFLELGHDALQQVLDAHPRDAVQVLTKLLRWVASAPTNDDAIAALADVEPGELPSVSALVGLTALKAASREWSDNRDNAHEPFWQRCLARHSFVLSQLFAHPLVVIQERAYLGGKALDDTGGSYLDFLLASQATEAVALIEIKTPMTRLLAKEYRGGAFPPSEELSGAVAQVLKYRRTFAKDFDRLARESKRDIVLGSVPCVVVIGDAKRELDGNTDLTESFEEFRAQLRDVRIVTYDELFAKVQVMADLLEVVPSARHGAESSGAALRAE